jgi:hypothetical protein
VRPFILLLAASAAAAQTGVPPRPACSQYPAHNGPAGASIVPPSQIAKVFSNSVARDYVVVEFAICPAPGQTIDLDALDFALNNGADSRSYPATPEEAAWHGKKPQTSVTSGPHVVAEAGVIVGSRTDPVTGRSEHGVATYGGVGVDNRPAPPAPPPAPADDPYAVEGRMRRMAFPAGSLDRPAAGYLYFPKGSAKKPKNAYGLEYSIGGQRKELSLPLK